MTPFRDKDGADGKRRQSGTVTAQMAMMSACSPACDPAGAAMNGERATDALALRGFLARVREKVEARADSLAVRGISVRRPLLLVSKNITRPNGTLLRCLRRTRLKH